MDLENDLGIPSDASLSPPSSISPATLILEGGDDLDTLVSVPSAENGIINGQTIPLCPEYSIRNSHSTSLPRCLVIGRQASAADIRIDHKSVSRRHTAIYYMINPTEEVAIAIQDLGGKHGTIVDNIRMEKNGTLTIPIVGGNKKDYLIQFGNAPAKCRLILPELKTTKDELHPDQSSEINDELQTTTDASKTNHTSAVMSEKNSVALDLETNRPEGTDSDEPDTRQSREAQIAAMIASFDSAPVYKKFMTPNEDNSASLNTNVIPKTTTQQGTAQRTDSNQYNLPITSSISLSPGSNSFSSSDGTNTPLQVNSSVSALCFEPSGARLVAGHRDGTLRFYDFHGMKPSTSSSSGEIYYTPFRIVDSDNDPLDSTGRHMLTCLGPSPSGAAWIVGTTSSQPKVIDREGSATLFNFVKGDNYVTDASNTKGHTSGVTGVAFHPLMKEVCFTCSRDGSIRQWDVSGRGKLVFQKWLVCQKVIGKCKNEKGQRTQITSNIGIHPSGRKIVVGTSCGSIQVWNCFGNSLNTRPLGAIYSTHGDMKPVTYVTFSNDGKLIASRSDQDNTVRVWDAAIVEKFDAAMSRKMANKRSNGNQIIHPSTLLLAVCRGLDALNEIPNCAFSPDGKVLCAGSSIDPRDKSANACGKLKFFKLPEDYSSKSTDKNSPKKKDTPFLEPIAMLDVAPHASVLGVAWHPKLNQIAFGTSNGA